VLTLASGAIAVLIAQVLLGAVTVKADLPASVVTAHLGTAMLLLAVTVLLALASFPRLRRAAANAPGGASDARAVRAFALIAAAGMYVLLLSGAYLASSNNGLACTTWPLCNGSLLPAGSGVQSAMTHRLLVVLVTVLIGLLIWIAARRQPRNYLLRRAVRDATGLFVLQIAIGALNVWTELASGIRILHLATGAALWAALVFIGWLGHLATLPRPTAEGSESALTRQGGSVRASREAAR
jgi:cytochrome c oxidase assembly protein subunit 15